MSLHELTKLALGGRPDLVPLIIRNPPQTLTVLTVPTIGSYPKAVYSDGPVVYWRLGESYHQTNAVDFAGDLMGVYQTAALWGSDAPGGGISGPTSPTFPGFEANNTAVQTTGDGVSASWVAVPTLPLSTNAATFHGRRRRFSFCWPVLAHQCSLSSTSSSPVNPRSRSISFAYPLVLAKSTVVVTEPPTIPNEVALGVVTVFLLDCPEPSTWAQHLKARWSTHGRNSHVSRQMRQKHALDLALGSRRWRWAR